MLVPELSQFSSQPGNRREIGPIEPSCALATYNHQAAVPQNRQMLRHCRPRNRKFRSNLTGRALIAPDECQDLPPRSVRNGAQHRVHTVDCKGILT